MEKQLLLSVLASFMFAVGFAQNKNVTFVVKSPDSSQVFAFGDWSNWGNYPGNVMTSIGGGYYSVTIPMTAGAHEFFFVNGTAAFVKEGITPTMPCTNGNAQYTNRTIAVANDTTYCATWKTCTSCTAPAANVSITFKVQNPDSTPVYVFGSWSNWSNFPGTAMTSQGGGIYQATITMPANATYEYLFVNGAGGTKEVLNPAWTCTNGNGQYTNRMLTVTTANQTICRRWAKCDSCNSVVPSNINVKFQVKSPDSTPVYVFGSWSNWSNFPGNQMTSVGNNTYEVTIPMASNQDIEYLFVNGTGTKEVLNSTWTCTNGNAQYTNRLTKIKSNDTTLCATWKSCVACNTTNIPGIATEKVGMSLSKNQVKLFTNDKMNIESLQIFDIIGRNVFTTNNATTNTAIPVEVEANKIYIIRARIQGQDYTFKGVVVE